MNKACLAAAGFGLLALAACGRSDQDQINTTQANETETLDELSDDAANLAAESAALENQAAQLDQEARNLEATQTETETADEENIQGM